MIYDASHLKHVLNRIPFTHGNSVTRTVLRLTDSRVSARRAAMRAAPRTPGHRTPRTSMIVSVHCGMYEDAGTPADGDGNTTLMRTMVGRCQGGRQRTAFMYSRFARMSE